LIRLDNHTSDVVIVGGGLVGLCASLALQKTGQTIRLLEASSLHQPESGGLNARSIALSYSSVQIFKALGVWPSIKKQAAPIRNIHISSQGRWGVSRLQASDYDIDALGYVIESRHLTASLLEKVEACDNITLLSEASFVSIENGAEVRIGYSHQQQVRQRSAKLALIADGAASSARASLGIEHNTIDYGQAAIICNVEFEKPLLGFAYERFTDQGPLALLPLAGNRYACVWTRSKEQTDSLMQADEQTFIGALQDCFGFRMGFIDKIGDRFCFDLKRTEATQLIQNRCVLIGNAANALHPVAGQGFNLALRDVAVLYELLAGQQVSELGEAAISGLLQQYEVNRKAEQRQVVRLGDGLVSLFSNELPLINHLRAGGLALLDQLPPLKTQVAMSGMGMAFGGNALLRGRL
jgi:2-octaprenyl-6-methoxyphenol hydroxylase